MTKSLSLSLMLLCALAMPARAADDYGIVVGGVAVTSQNAGGVADGSSDNLRGHISFDPATNTLTLRDAYVDIVEPVDGSSIDYGIHITREHVNIVAEGHNSIFGPLMGIYGHDIAIGGQGYLDVEGQGCGLMARSVVIADGCSVTCGSVNNCLSTPDLTVDGSSLTLVNNGYSTLQQFTDLGRVELINCQVTAPETGVTYHPDLHQLTDDGNVDGNVVISPITTGARLVHADTAHKPCGTYTLSGQRVDTPTQPGIYIRNGRIVYHP